VSPNKNGGYTLSKLKKIAYRGANHSSFEEEWGVHKGCSEWWYATGYLNDEAGWMYSFQFTLIRVKKAFLRPYVLMLALTDFETGKHRYVQKLKLFGRDMTIDANTVRFGEIAEVVKEEEGIYLTTRNKSFSFDLMLNYGKGAVWHCDKGLLKMGIDAPKQTTLYYSYPNMPATGVLTFGGKERSVNGKAWFDKQCGPYTIKNPKTHWEWFSLRFFDDEEMMLFSFPKDNYRDGTYIHRNGSTVRLNHYTVTPLDFIYPDGKTKYSFGWKVSVPGFKDENYTVKPLLRGQINLGYYELLAGIFNNQNEQIGMCFVELLPGAYNDRYPDTLFAKSEG
jgi:predicted secreted hydrolase